MCIVAQAQVTERIDDEKTLKGVTVSTKRVKYSRKDNPAVELMRKVIANKRRSDLHEKDYFTYTKYEKMTFSLNEVSDRVFEEGEYKRFAFLKDHVERSPQTGKLILPLTVDETLSEIYYRRDPHSEKSVIKGESNKGVTELVNTGEILTTTLKDIFTDIDIYENECRLLQYPFRSPIADNATKWSMSVSCPTTSKTSASQATSTSSSPPTPPIRCSESNSPYPAAATSTSSRTCS